MRASAKFDLNRRRAHSAEAALLAFIADFMQSDLRDRKDAQRCDVEAKDVLATDPAEIVTDLLTNLMLYCDRRDCARHAGRYHKISFQRCLASALIHFEAEKL